MEIITKFWYLPIISAFIGWLTNWIAVKMLFHPVKPLNFYLFTIQGIIPKRKESLARGLAKNISENFLVKDELQNLISSSIEGKEIKGFLKEKVDTFLNEKLGGLNPMIAMFLTDNIKNNLSNLLLNHLIEMIPDVSNKILENSFSKIDFEKEVFVKLVGVSTSKIENLLENLLKNEFFFIEIIGGIIGFIIGIFQILLILIGI